MYGGVQYPAARVGALASEPRSVARPVATVARAAPARPRRPVVRTARPAQNSGEIVRGTTSRRDDVGGYGK
jgi:hypothetical protein